MNIGGRALSETSGCDGTPRRQCPRARVTTTLSCFGIGVASSRHLASTEAR